MIRRSIYIIILSIVALISLVVVLPRASRVETYQRYIQSIDQKKDEVTVLSVSSATASALISVLPEDTATPIADELADLSKTFLTVLTVLYAEKYLFPIIGVTLYVRRLSDEVIATMPVIEDTEEE